MRRAARARAAIAAVVLLAAAPARAELPPALQALPAATRVDAALAELGRQLFFEPRLSGDGSRSCASCHEPVRGFADGQPLSRGYNGTEYFRNAPGLLSVRLKTRLTWDGRLDGADLATAVRDMVTEAHFMNADARLVQERVRQIPALMQAWRRAFGDASEPYGPRLFAAIAEYLRTLDAPDTPVDRHLRGERVALPPALREGLALFHGKAGCARCHHGPLGSDGRAHRLGVPASPAVSRDALRMITLLRHHATMGVPGYMDEREDLGGYVVSKVEADRGRFVTPSLRMLTHTAPYLHDGSLATLEEVLDFHLRGGGAGSELAPVALEARERAALLALLRALSPPLPAYPQALPQDYAALPRGRR
ncbi:MAG: photosynthetic protein synthase I [Burkholderiales bacterium]|nr:photosynthetic protein synthase I [Burkholderiales bacterium]